MKFVDLKTQYESYREELQAAMNGVLESTQFIMGPQVKELEEKLASFVGVKHCVGASSGTDTLLMALMALGVGPGDEVITVPFTFISTVEVIALLGAKPIFVDIDEETYNLDVNQVEAAITPQTKAIIGVSLFGQMADYEKLNAIAGRHGVVVIEDGAQSFGARQGAKKSCGVTKIGSTSFFPAKPLGCYGDGGALFTDDDALAEAFRSLRVHGSIKKYYHDRVGLTGRLDTLQAAVLLVKLKHFDKEVELRQKVGQRYTKLLDGVCVTPKVKEGNTHIYAVYTIRVPKRDEVVAELSKRGVPTAVYYPLGMHEQKAFSNCGYKRGDFPVSEKMSLEVLSLPMHPWLKEREQDQIVAAVKEVVK